MDLSLILSILPNDVDFGMIWRLFLLALARFAMIIANAPFLGAKTIPIPVRIIFATVLSFVFFPHILTELPSLDTTMMSFIVLIFKELFVGFIIGFYVSLPFFIIQTSGIMIDFMRGSSMMMAQDPTLQVQSSSIGIMLNQILVVIFYANNGVFFFFNIIEKSFSVIPLNQFISLKFFETKNFFWQTTFELLNQVFALSIELAAPVLLAILMSEVFLGIANRMAPQVQIAFLGMPIKSLVALILLWAGWFFILRQASDISLDYVKTIESFFYKIPSLKN